MTIHEDVYNSTETGESGKEFRKPSKLWIHSAVCVGTNRKAFILSMYATLKALG